MKNRKSLSNFGWGFYFDGAQYKPGKLRMHIPEQTDPIGGICNK
jgi:hypothetical protein